MDDLMTLSSVKQVFVHLSKTGFFVLRISNVRVPNYLHTHYLKQDEMSANYRQKIVSVNIPLKGCVKNI